MDINGVVRDATDGSLLPGAKVSLYIGEEELAVIPTNDKGEFTHSRATSYIGQILTCQVEKEQYQTKKETHKIEHDEVHLEIKLLRDVSPPAKEIEVRFDIKDEGGNPLGGVNVTLEVEAEQVGTGRSDKAGLFETTLRADLEGKTVNYRAELTDYESVKGEIQLKKQTSCQISMKKTTLSPKPPEPPQKFAWRLPVFGAIGGIIGAIIGAIVKNPIINIPLWAIALGVLLGIGLKDKKKIVGLIIAGIIGFYAAFVIVLINLLLYPIGTAVIGLALGIGLNYRKTILKLIVAGFIAGFVAAAMTASSAALGHFVLPLLGLGFGVALGLPGKEQKQ